MVGFGTRAQAPLSLGDALRLTEESNPKLTAARAQIDGASAGIMTAQQIANPELDTLSGSNRARTAGIGSGNFTSIGVSQLIELPAVRSSRIGAAQAGREANAAALAELRLELRAAVKQAYFEVLQRKGEVSLALETEALLTQIRNRIDARVRIGEAARFELTRADAELARARTVSATARLRVLQALSTLRTTIGVPIAENSDIAAAPFADQMFSDTATLRSEIESRHPALLQARAIERRAQLRLDNERALRTPQPTLVGRAERQPESNQFLLGLSLPLPLFNQRQGQIGEALALLDEARAAVTTRRVGLLGALDIALHRTAIARAQISAFEGGLIQQAESALAIADAAYRLGERGFIEVLDAQRVLRQVRGDALAARFELQSALIEIERLRAADLPPLASDPITLEAHR